MAGEKREVPYANVYKIHGLVKWSHYSQERKTQYHCLTFRANSMTSTCGRAWHITVVRHCVRKIDLCLVNHVERKERTFVI